MLSYHKQRYLEPFISHFLSRSQEQRLYSKLQRANNTQSHSRGRIVSLCGRGTVCSRPEGADTVPVWRRRPPQTLELSCRCTRGPSEKTSPQHSTTTTGDEEHLPSFDEIKSVSCGVRRGCPEEEGSQDERCELRSHTRPRGHRGHGTTGTVQSGVRTVTHGLTNTAPAGHATRLPDY